jgi:hypothetical protein
LGYQILRKLDVKVPEKLKNAERRLKPQAAQLEGVTRRISESLFTTNGHSPKAALPHFSLPRAKLRPRGQLLPLKMVGSPALSDETGAAVKPQMEQHREKDENHFVLKGLLSFR